MLLHEFASDPVVHFHDRLNPRLWNGTQLRPEVRLHLLEIARAFRDSLDIPALPLRDVILTGSNAAYTYTDSSDADVHLVVDVGAVGCPELADELLRAKKALWAATYDLTVRGIPVEMYVENTAEPVHAAGVFSLLRNAWVARPRHVPPPHDDAAVLRKTADYAAAIEAALSAADAAPDSAAIDDLFDRLRRLRRAGLQTGGEASTENLVFKRLRAAGYMDRLWQARVRTVDRTLSLA